MNRTSQKLFTTQYAKHTSQMICKLLLRTLLDRISTHHWDNIVQISCDVDGIIYQLWLMVAWKVFFDNFIYRIVHIGHKLGSNQSICNQKLTNLVPKSEKVDVISSFRFFMELKLYTHALDITFNTGTCFRDVEFSVMFKIRHLKN